MTNFHIIKVSYLGPTDFNGSRVKLTSARFGTSKVIPYDYSSSRIEEMAEKYLIENGFEIVGQGETGKGDSVIITNTFKNIK